MRCLQKRLALKSEEQDLSEEMKLRFSSLSLLVLEDLSEAFLDFTTLADLETWLLTHA
ncbi:MAG: DUF4351 domain-containing protein [Aphanocapsa sp. GSE-SYN-MK-11-07L]|nr:DUF4351 domain-containing protein [Aphanocapsa sp. GSE-SYN-MK-11-07L]